MKAKAKIGQYFFGRNYRIWAIWIYEEITEQGTRASKVETCCTYEEAVTKTFELNGWRTPKYIARKF